MPGFMMHTFTCFNEDCEADIEVEIEISSYGHRGVSASFNNPGEPAEGPEFNILTTDLKCEKCGRDHTEEEILEREADAIVESIAESSRDY